MYVQMSLMLRKSRIALGLIATTIACAPLSAVSAADDAQAEKPAAEGASPYGLVPAETGVLVRFRNPRDAAARLAKLAGNIDPQFAPLVQQVSLGMGAMISNPTLEGIEKDGNWWVAVIPQTDADPHIVFIVPTSDVATFQAAILGEVHFATSGKWVLYGEHKAAVEKFTQRIAGEGKSIEPLLSRAARGIFEDGDISLFVNVPVLRTTYRRQIDKARDDVDGFLQQMQNFQGDAPGVDIGAIFKMYADMIKGVFQSLEDADSLTATVNVAADDVRFDEYFEFAADSGTDRFLKVHPPGPMSDLLQLPADSHLYYGFEGDMQALVKWGFEISSSFMTGDEESRRQLKAYMDEYAKLKMGGYIGSFHLGELEGGAMRGTSVIRVKPVAGMRDLVRRTPEFMGNLSTPGMQQEVTLTPEASKIGETPIDRMLVKQTFNEETDPLGIQKGMLEVLYGPGGLTTRIAYLEDRVAQSVGGDLKGMEALLAALNGKSDKATGKHKAFQSARKAIGEDANLAVLIDLTGLATDALELIMESGKVPIPVTADQVDATRVPRSYGAVGISTGPRHLRVRSYLPVEQMQGFRRIARLIQELQQEPEL